MDSAATIRWARREAGLSLRALAERAGTSHATLSDYEHSRRVPRVDTLHRILRAAGFSSDIELERRADDLVRREAKGRELVAALELAGQFPARHEAEVTAPVFPRGRS